MFSRHNPHLVRHARGKAGRGWPIPGTQPGTPGKLANLDFRKTGIEQRRQYQVLSSRAMAWPEIQRVVGVYATHRRDADSRWPAGLWRGTCITTMLVSGPPGVLEDVAALVG